MTKTKWIRRALLGGAAVAVMATGAQADDLSALKAQIEALQARVNTIESRGAALPEGVSLLTVARGHKAIAMSGDKHDINAVPEDRGLTISVTPTADLPAPATEITISGYVRALAVWSDTRDPDVGGIGVAVDDADFNMTARGQIDIKSKTDTAIGQVRTHIRLRGDYSAPGSVNTTMHVAYGEWDMSDSLTLRAGHTTQIAALTNAGYGTVLIPYGIDSSRKTQMMLRVNNGPLQFGFGIENPSSDSPQTVAYPDFAAYARYNAGAFSMMVSGEVGAVGDATVNDTDMGWVAGVGVGANLGMVKMSVGFAWSHGLGNDGIVSGARYARVGGTTGKLADVWGVLGNVGFALNDTTSFNLAAGYYNYVDDLTPFAVAEWDHGYSVGANIVWKPVNAFQFAIEGQYRYDRDTNDGFVGEVVTGRRRVFTAAFGTWFFF